MYIQVTFYIDKDLTIVIYFIKFNKVYFYNILIITSGLYINN